MTSIYLAQTLIEVLEPGKAAYELRDTDLKGFGVRVLPSGRMRYFVHSQCRGRRVWKIVGKGEVISAGEARSRATALLAAIRRGEDAPT